MMKVPAMRETLAAIGHLEDAVLGAEWTEGIVLRYGVFYGPGTSLAQGEAQFELVREQKLPLVGDGGGVWSFIHIADAAEATLAAVEHGSRGVYNVVNDDPAPVAEWLPALAQTLGAKEPLRVPRFVGRLFAGEAGVAMMTEIRGASNAKAKRELGWSPAHPSWRQGFVAAAGRPTRPPSGEPGWRAEARAWAGASSYWTSCGRTRSRSPTACSAASPRPRTWCRKRCFGCI